MVKLYCIERVKVGSYNMRVLRQMAKSTLKKKSEYQNTYIDPINDIIDMVNIITTSYQSGSTLFSQRKPIYDLLQKAVSMIVVGDNVTNRMYYLNEFSYYISLLLGMTLVYQKQNSDIYQEVDYYKLPKLFALILANKLLFEFRVKGDNNLLKKRDDLLKISNADTQKSRIAMMNILFNIISSNLDITNIIYEFDETIFNVDDVIIHPSDYYITWFFSINALRQVDNLLKRNIANVVSPDEYIAIGEKLSEVAPSASAIDIKDESTKINTYTAILYREYIHKNHINTKLSYTAVVAAYRKLVKNIVNVSNNGWVLVHPFFSGLSNTEILELQNLGIVNLSGDWITLTELGASAPEWLGTNKEKQLKGIR